jgi:membrane-bound serine protease (ClpP class)
MKHWALWMTAWATAWGMMAALPADTVSARPKKVYVIPIRDNIEPPMAYLVRRGVKEALASHADLLVIDMDTNGGRVDVTQEIIEILNQFHGPTVTFVNRKAFSAGAFISVATQKIFMAPQSVIGAAAPIMMSPGGGGVESMPDTVEVKMTSALSALVRANAEKNGHNTAVVQKMIDKSSELKMDGAVLNEKGGILTLTNLEAEKEYGTPRRKLLSAGTVESLDEVLKIMGFAGATVLRIQTTGMEKLAFYINAISPFLLMIGIVGVYIEFKTPGFGVPGVVAIIAFTIYFLGGYVAGLSGMEWLAVFIVGVLLVVVELFVLPGHVIPGLIGMILMLVAVVMALADLYPAPSIPATPGFVPRLPNMLNLGDSLRNLLIASVGSVAAAVILARFLPQTSFYRNLVSESASGVTSVAETDRKQAAELGLVGVSVSPLRPGGKARFGDAILDVIAQGGLIPRDRQVRVIGHSGAQAIVEEVAPSG